MIKKLLLGTFAFLALPVMIAYAATPALTVSGTGNSNVAIQVSGGEINSPVLLYYFNPLTGLYQSYNLGMTNASGTFSGALNTSVIGNLGANLGAPVYVQVAGYESSRIMWPYTSFTSTSGTGVTFSNSFPSLSVGQNGSIFLSGGSGTYYVASNSHANGVSASISGNTLTLSGSAAGQATIMVCSTGGGCGTLVTTVQGTSSPTLSQSSLSFMQGNQGAVAITGGTGPFTVRIPAGSGITTNLTGNALHVTGNATGTAVLSICSSMSGNGNEGCVPLTVTVQEQANNSSSNNNASSTNNLASQFNFTVPLSVGQALSFNLGGNGTFFLQSPVTSPVLASINDGNRLMVNGSAMGSGSVSVCQVGGSCFPINFVVHPAAQSTVTTPPFTGTGGGTLLLVNLGRGMSGPEVADLQTRLKEEGYFSPTVTGYFGGATQAAVKRYQRDRGLPVTGFVGVQTRAMLNQ